MKKAIATDERRGEYERKGLGVGVRGTHYEEYQKGTHLALLSPDVAEVFSTEEAVNAALRSLISLAQKSTARKSRFVVTLSINPLRSPHDLRISFIQGKQLLMFPTR